VADGEAEPDVRKPRRLRVLLFLLVGGVAAAFAIRAALSFFAADLFLAVVREAASRNGLEIAIEGAPVVTSSGFEAGGVTVRSVGGDELLRADSVSGTARFFLRRPYLGVSLVLVGARSTWSPSSDKSTSSSSTLPDFPPQLVRIELKDARIDFGSGRVVSMEAVVDEPSGAFRIAATRLDYSEDSGENAAEKLAGTLLLSSDAAAGVRASLSIDKGAALAGAVLVDFHAHPLTAAARIASDEKGLWSGSGLELALGKLLRASGSIGFADDGAVRTADLAVSSDDLMPAFVTLVREPFGGVIPAVADAALQGRGQIRVKFPVASRHSTDATLSLSLKSLRTRSLEGESLSLELPWIGAALAGRASRTGSLRAAKLSLLGLPWTGVDVAVTASPGNLRAKAVQQWKSVGGTMRVSDLVLQDDARSGPRASANVVLEGFELVRLGEALAMRGPAGSLRGDLGRVRIDADAIRADGTIDIRTLGGSLRLSKLFVEQPFARVPELGMDVKVDEIDLGALTEQFGVGRISGVLEGQVTGLVLAAGQPQAFDADLHTVKRSGVSQTVDVRAIVQLGVLGGGDGSSITGTLLRMIDRYRYSALGVKCRLRNDVFELRGVESDGGKDYIIKRSLLPPSVSVVSHSHVVSFSEMLRRVQRITAIGEGGSPNAPSP